MAIKDALVVRQLFSFRGVMHEIGTVIHDAKLMAEVLVEHPEKVIPAKHDVIDEPEAEASSSAPTPADVPSAKSEKAASSNSSSSALTSSD